MACPVSWGAITTECQRTLRRHLKMPNFAQTLPAIDEMTKNELLEKLNSTKSSDRRRAAKEIGKLKLVDFGNQLYESYLIEKQDKRTWETQTEMIKSLGLLDYKKASLEMERISNENKPHDMITSAAATSFVQLTRQSIYDSQPVLTLLNFGSVSVISGALQSLAIDRMMPPENEIELIIKKSWDINKHPDRIGQEFGLIDSRIYVALACSQWNQNLTSNFLNHCIKTAININRFNQPVQNTNLIAVCENSLNGIFSKRIV